MENSEPVKKKRLHKLKKRLLIFLSIIILLVTLVIAFISPITKYLIEKYDEEYTGRKITIGWAYVNPFTGYVHLSNLKIYELKSDSVFFSTNGLSVNIEMLKMLSKTYEISELSLNHPRGIIIQNNKDFNFKDLIEKFSPTELVDTTKIKKAPVHFNILSIKIIDGEFHLNEKVIPIKYFIKNVNFESTGKRWDSDTISANFSFSSGFGTGDIEGNFTINLTNMDYRFAVLINKFDLNILAQYVKDMTNYGSMRAMLDANIKTTGNFKDKDKIRATGMFAINDFHFGKNPKDDYVSFDKLIFAIKELSPRYRKYLFDSISLDHPYVKYERYDSLDNIQNIFGKNGSNVAAANANPAKFNLIIEIANYIKMLSKNFFRSDYKINRLAIYKADFKYNDYAISEKFSMELNPLTFIADSIDKKYARVNAYVKSSIKPYGDLSVAVSINPKDSSDFDIQYHMQKLPLSLFNPYTLTYTSFPLDRGSFEFKGVWKVRNGIIQSDNHLLLIDPRVSKRIKNKDMKWIPMPLIMAFVRDRGNVIDYHIPITGDLNNPKFNLWDILGDLFKNIVIKPATTPYRMQVKNVETEIEKSLTLKWQMRQVTLRTTQKKFIEKMADFLVKNPTAAINIYPQNYAVKEKEYILFFEAKKKYYMLVNNKNAQTFSENDSEKVNKMSAKNPQFVEYLNKYLKNSNMLFTVQEKCSIFIDSAFITAKFNQLNKERINEFMSYFNEKGLDKRIRILPGVNMIPYNGFSFYKIDYKGEFPESIISAYREMEELNDEAPRNEFKKERKKNGAVLYENTILLKLKKAIGNKK